jgi:hypothetical protein
MRLIECQVNVMRAMKKMSGSQHLAGGKAKAFNKPRKQMHRAATKVHEVELHKTKDYWLDSKNSVLVA